MDFVFNSQQYQVIPGGCSDVTNNSSCNGNNVLTKNWISAKGYCDNMVYGGNSDWFLPSKEELTVMWNQKNKILGFGPHNYRSSDEYNSNKAWVRLFSSNGILHDREKIVALFSLYPQNLEF